MNEPINLNEHKSGFITEPDKYEVSIVEAKHDYTKSSQPCVIIKFENDKGQTITATYVEAMYWKLNRVAQAAGLNSNQMEAFQPSMLIGKRVLIVVEKGEKYTNVSEVYMLTGSAKPVTSDEVPF